MEGSSYNTISPDVNVVFTKTLKRVNTIIVMKVYINGNIFFSIYFNAIMICLIPHLFMTLNIFFHTNPTPVYDTEHLFPH